MIVDHLYNYLLSGLSFFLVLGIAIMIHEGGHFLFARLSGIRVEKFSIGFGRALWSFKRGDTEYILAPIPMGGYVKMAGDNPAEVTGKPDEFYSISPWRRIPTVVAGPGANLVGAFLILFGLAFLFGKSYDYNVIGTVIPGSIEDQAGLKPNDVLLSMDGEKTATWEEYLDAFDRAREAKKQEVSIEVQRGTETLNLVLPVSKEATDKCLVLSFCEPDGPAFELGLREGDRVMAVNGKQPPTWSEFSKSAKQLWEETPSGPLAKTVTLTWQTVAGDVKSASITPVLVRDTTGDTVALFGMATAVPGISAKIPPVVGRVMRGFPAAEADIRPGAQIISINGNLVENAEQVEKVVSFSYSIPEGKGAKDAVPVPVDLAWRNPGTESVQSAKLTPSVELTPMRSQIGLQSAKEFPLARLGIAFEKPMQSLGFVESLVEGARGTVEACVETWFVLKGLVTGQVNKKLIGGPVAILQISAKVGKEGLRQLLWLCAFLQANLALLNLLPIPVLDGGHLVVALCEGISRRTFSLKTREAIQYVGLVILIPLFAFVFYNDFDRLGLFNWIKEWVS